MTAGESAGGGCVSLNGRSLGGGYTGKLSDIQGGRTGGFKDITGE